MMNALALYLALERLMLELDESANPAADQIRDLMDPVWRQLSDDELARLDARGEMGRAGFFPLQFPAPRRPELQSPTVENQTFGQSGWQAPPNWHGKAA